MYIIAYLTLSNVVHCLLHVHATPVIEHEADTAGTEDKPHVTLSSLEGGLETAVLQL